MKKRSIIFIVCIILMNSLSGCIMKDKQYLMVCEKNEESIYGEVNRIVELYFVNDELLLKNIIEKGIYDVDNHEKVIEEINNDYVKYSAYEGVNYLGNTINNSSFTKQLTINLGNMNDSLLEFFDAETISKKNKVSYSYEYNQLKETGYACKLEDVDVNDTIIVKSIKITPLERFEGIMFNENGEKDIYTGFQIELTTEPYNVESWEGDHNPVIIVWHDRKLYEEVFNVGMIDDRELGRVSLGKVGYTSMNSTGRGAEEIINDIDTIEFTILFDELKEYTERLDEVLITVVYNSKTMRSQKVKVTK